MALAEEVCQELAPLPVQRLESKLRQTPLAYLSRDLEYIENAKAMDKDALASEKEALGVLRDEENAITQEIWLVERKVEGDARQRLKAIFEGSNGRSVEITSKLQDWLFESIARGHVGSVSSRRNYFGVLDWKLTNKNQVRRGPERSIWGSDPPEPDTYTIDFDPYYASDEPIVIPRLSTPPRTAEQLIAIHTGKRRVREQKAQIALREEGTQSVPYGSVTLQRAGDQIRIVWNGLLGGEEPSEPAIVPSVKEAADRIAAEYEAFLISAFP